MLIEIKSDQFRIKRIAFHKGLNVVLGDENATNSIGKSTLLMVIDFAFGGSSLLEHNKDLTDELGHHDYFFTFQFGDETQVFRRGTYEPDIVYRCTDEYDPTSPQSLEEYTAFLKQSYGIYIEDISFRNLVGLYFRVWGKENLDVHKPLHVVHGQSARECVNTLIKTFGRYGSIKNVSEQLKKKEEERRAWAAAFKTNIIPKIGKREHRENEGRLAQMEREIEDIKVNLAKYATNIAAVVNREVLELKIAKDQLLETKMKVESQLIRVRRNLSQNRHIKSKHFAGLVKFFPDVNQDRLASVEEFHSGVARLLGTELREAERELKAQLDRILTEVDDIDSKMTASLSSVEEPTQIVDRVYGLATSMQEVKSTNEHYEMEIGLKASIESLSEELSSEKVKVLSIIESALNDGLRRIVTSVFGPDRKSPTINLKENNYSYEVFEDTGTGTAYTGLIVFDLTVFALTALPFIAHDSLLFKNIENDSVAALFQIYLGINKQSFVTIDEIKKYGPETAALLEASSVIQLDDDHVLYIKDWRTKKTS